jgi:hypothetical protein
MTLPRFAVVQCGYMDEEYLFPKTTVSTLLSVIIFTGRSFPHHTFKGARGAHKRHQGYNYSYHWVQNSYQLFQKPWFDTILLLFYISPLPTLDHIVTKARQYFFDHFSYRCYYITKNCRCLIGWQLFIPNVNRHAYSYL